MRKVNNKYIFILGLVLGIIISVTTAYAVESYIESNKVTYNNHNKENVQEAIDELYEKSGIHQNKWIDPILNGADPVLKDPLIPVEIKNNGEVYYANENSEWYNYSEKRWANAVILIDNPSNTNYGVGDHILESDIESYFVWIPRYQYKIWDLGNYTSVISVANMKNVKDDEVTSFHRLFNNAKLIDIKFGTYETYPKMTEPTTTDVYYTHPAFTLGNKELNGIWVGKFETGGTTNSIVIKPNVTSLRNENIKTFFDTAKGYNTNLDSHMMKNTEWGAVVYLSHSAYGIGNQIRINNNSSFKTGYSATADADQSTTPGVSGTEKAKTQPWNTEVGYLASTTGNISGIYDMSGGVNEYMAACIEDNIGDSDFTTTELSSYMDQGYIDKYSKDSKVSSYDKRILGDATGELGPFYSFYQKNGVPYYVNSWYYSNAGFLESTRPWFNRGGYYADGSIVSDLTFDRYITGSSSNTCGFRLVLA